VDTADAVVLVPDVPAASTRYASADRAGGTIGVVVRHGPAGAMTFTAGRPQTRKE
jgi:hypothetical protein